MSGWNKLGRAAPRLTEAGRLDGEKVAMAMAMALLSGVQPMNKLRLLLTFIDPLPTSDQGPSSCSRLLGSCRIYWLPSFPSHRFLSAG